MSKVRRALKDLYGDPFTNSYCDAQALAMLLTQFEYTKHEIDYLKQNGKEISDIFKARLSEYLHKKNKDKFDFQTTVGPTGGTVHIVNADGEDILWRTVFHYNLNK
jgi:nicotinic acid phosphoribosyltransferase